MLVDSTCWKTNSEISNKILNCLNVANKTICYPPYNRAAGKALNTFQNDNFQNALRGQGYDLGQNVPKSVIATAFKEMYSKQKFTGNVTNQDLRKYISAALCSFYSQYGTPEHPERHASSQLNRIQRVINELYYWGSGNCNHYAVYMMQLLLAAGIYPVDLVWLPNGTEDGTGHQVVVVSLSSPHKIATLWENDAIVVDPWQMKAYPTSDLLNPQISGLSKYKGDTPISNIRIDDSNFAPNLFYIPDDPIEKESYKEFIEENTNSILSVMQYQYIDNLEMASPLAIKLKKDHKREAQITCNQERTSQRIEKSIKNTIWMKSGSTPSINPLQNSSTNDCEYSSCVFL